MATNMTLLNNSVKQPACFHNSLWRLVNIIGTLAVYRVSFSNRVGVDSSGTHMNTSERKTQSQVACLQALILFSALIAFMNYPDGSWQIGAGLGLHSLLSLFLPVGWVVPFTIAGAYFGIIVLDSPLKSGAFESKTTETICSILFGTVVGFVIGASVDVSSRSRRKRASNGAIARDKEDDGHEAVDDADCVGQVIDRMA